MGPAPLRQARHRPMATASTVRRVSARGGNRTRKPLRAADFESAASASFATRAYDPYANRRPATGQANANEERTAKQKLEVSTRQKDGSTLRARIEKRAEGTYAIDLRAWQLGRPTANAHTTMPGWDRKQTTKPTTFMMVIAMTGSMVARIGGGRWLLRGPGPTPLAFLTALGLTPTVFTDSHCQCVPIIPVKAVPRG
jgi:hypothetical protein